MKNFLSTAALFSIILACCGHGWIASMSLDETITKLNRRIDTLEAKLAAQQSRLEILNTTICTCHELIEGHGVWIWQSNRWVTTNLSAPKSP